MFKSTSSILSHHIKGSSLSFKQSFQSPTVLFHLQSRNYNDVFKASEMEITRNTHPKDKPNKDEPLLFGRKFTDHMLEVEWDDKSGWHKPKIVPYHNLEIAPSCSALHYAIQCFEGMKAYSDEKGENSYLFRPEKNAQRLNSSCARLGLPVVDEQEFIKCLAKLIDIEKEWIPKQKGYSLYIRPTCISTESNLGVFPPKKALLYVILSPVGPYFPTGFQPVKLFANPKYIRAFPGGTGHYKLGANYGPTILPQIDAAKEGFSQVLWLYGEDYQLSEVGTMNIFIYRTNDEGKEELVTPPLDGTILPGVTRDTILKIAEEWGIPTSQRKYTMSEIKRDSEAGRIKEVFGAGTACIVSPVSGIHFKEEDIPIPAPEEGLAHRLFDHILDVQHGKIPSSFRVNVRDVLEKQ